MQKRPDRELAEQDAKKTRQKMIKQDAKEDSLTALRQQPREGMWYLNGLRAMQRQILALSDIKPRNYQHQEPQSITRPNLRYFGVWNPATDFPYPPS
jgi:hypothetical protein